MMANHMGPSAGCMRREGMKGIANMGTNRAWESSALLMARAISDSGRQMQR